MKYYFKVALRNLLRDKTHSLIHISGLAVGMAVVLLIGAWIYNQFSFEKFNPNYDRIARVMVNFTVNGINSTSPSTPVPLADELRNQYGSSFAKIARSWWNQNRTLGFGDKKLKQSGKFMEPDGPDLLALTMVEGSRSGLSGPASILLSASTAQSIFGKADPMGKILTIDGKMTASVNGVYQDLPDNSQFSDVQFIGSWQLFSDSHGFVRNSRNNWGYDIEEIYVQLADHVNEPLLSAKLKNSILDHLNKNGDAAGFHPLVFLDPMSRWHLYSPFSDDTSTSGLIQFVLLFGTIGVFVLVLACINFINLSTAGSERRAKEVGIRKTIGSGRRRLIAQFFSESLLISVFAFILSLALVRIAMPFFSDLAGKKISIQWGNFRLWLIGLGFCLAIGLAAGIYPALYLSSFRPVAVLKGVFRAGRSGANLRRILVVLQFTISTILVIATMVVYHQINFAKDRKLGYDREGLLSFAIYNPEYIRKLPTLRQALMQTGVVSATTETSSSATEDGDFYAGYSWPEKDPATVGEFSTFAVSPSYGATIGWVVKEGRDFSKDFETDSEAVLVNEAAVRFMGLKNPIGEKITYWNGRQYTIIGVVKNVLMSSPYQDPVKAVYMPIEGIREYTWLLVKMKQDLPVGTTLDKIRSAWKKILPSALFDYQFVEEDYAKKFSTEQRIGQLAAAFSFLALLISALGIFGMASFIAQQRTKEVSIRKVLGASIFQLWQLLSKEFLWLVCLSFSIAMPLAFYSMHRWLERYPYHANISWWIFLCTAAGVLTITLLTISFQLLKTALANPIKRLRME
jgi:putative ABC transport system permease protein